jgi:hypothetical protein
MSRIDNTRLAVNTAFRELKAEDDPFYDEDVFQDEGLAHYKKSHSVSSSSSEPTPETDSPPSEETPVTSAGTLPDGVYEKLLPGYRYQMRKLFMKSLELECPNLKVIQDSMRSPFGDWWFGMASLLG